MSRMAQSRPANRGRRASILHRAASLLAAATLLVTASGPSLAQEVETEDGEPQVFDFEEDEISTDYLKPTTMMVEGLRRGRMSSLISVRLHFVDQIVKSAEDI